MAKRFGEQLDRRADAFIRRRFGGFGLYGPPNQGWWPQFRIALAAWCSLALIVLVALVVSGRSNEAPRLLGTAALALAAYAISLTVATQVRARRARRARNDGRGDPPAPTDASAGSLPGGACEG